MLLVTAVLNRIFAKNPRQKKLRSSTKGFSQALSRRKVLKLKDRNSGIGTKNQNASSNLSLGNVSLEAGSILTFVQNWICFTFKELK